MNNPQLTYYDLGEGVTAFSTTRHGGCSTGNYGEFNINNYCGDEVAHIAENRRALSTLLGIDESHIVMPHQVHGTEVRRIDGPQQEVIEGVDAVMTNVSKLCIGVSTADCIPVIIYDKEHHAACAVHVGWRGTVQRIVRVAVEAMYKTYGSDPSQMKAVVGPGISLESFEVGEEVYQQFADAGFNMRLIARKYAKWHIDLPTCNRLQLAEAGITDVYMSGICTYQQYHDYFSARRLGINSGRIFTGVMIR
ncbi:MAG: peptidoglycan editing factor PgeF [Prevotella sp.]|nr:peptidoglycan editing factor PgeF [Prevotella sp.]